MSEGDVHGFEMDAPHPLDDAAAEALLRGSGRDVDPSLADLVGDLRVAYSSSPPMPGAALAAFLTTGSETPTTTSRRSERMLSSLLAKVGVATAAVFAATGGLAMASALPAPVQDAVSHLGVGAPAHHGHPSHPAGTEVDETTTSTTVSSGTTDETTTVPDGSTTTTVAGEHPDNHGADVSAVAHDDSLQGCEHGHAVAAVASNGKSKDKACPSTTSTTLADGTTTTTVADGQGDGETATTVAGADSTNSGSDHGSSGDHGNGSSGGHSNG